MRTHPPGLETAWEADCAGLTGSVQSSAATSPMSATFICHTSVPGPVSAVAASPATGLSDGAMA
jgi:hypothetical protein